MAQVTALNPRKKLLNDDHVVTQDMTFQDEKLKRLKKMMNKHPGKNTDWDPELRTKQLAQVEDTQVSPTISRQVRRQVERLKKKLAKTHKFGKKMVLDYYHRVQRVKDPKTGLITHRIVQINRITLTQVNTSRYVPHMGANIRYMLNGRRVAV